MKIKFSYSKKHDHKCWKKYNRFIKKNKTVWGISRKIKPIIKIKNADIEMQVGDTVGKYKKIFKVLRQELPALSSRTRRVINKTPVIAEFLKKSVPQISSRIRVKKQGYRYWCP